MIPNHTTIQVRSSGLGRAGIGRSSWKGLARDATRRSRFVVHAASWLHSMVHHGRAQIHCCVGEQQSVGDGRAQVTH